MLGFTLLVAKLSTAFIQLLHLGSGSTWPGHIALEMNRHFIPKILKKNKHLTIILIAGTNGKTTTSKLMRFLLEKNSYSTLQNEEGANLLNGIASSLVRHANLSGTIKESVAIFEIDENTLPPVLHQVRPDAVILLNLFRDQLDRYGEVTSIADKWQKALFSLSSTTHLFINGDDPQLAYLGTHLPLKVTYFGISQDLMQKKDIPHDVDSIYCPNCKKKLNMKKIAYSHLGIFSCSNCNFTHPKTSTYSHLALSYPLKGDYIMYNTHAVMLALSTLFEIPAEQLATQLTNFRPAFGRQEVIEVGDKKVFLLLSKNPTGFNQSIATVLQMHTSPFNCMLLLNDRVADGHDVSWIWDVEFEDLLPHTSHVVVSGDRAYDMALRLHYADDQKQLQVGEHLSTALSTALKNTPAGEVLYILATYTAMLDIRKLLLGKKLL